MTKVVLDSLTKWAKWIGAASLTGMMLLTCADVSLRYFGHPIFGTYEIIALMLLLVVAFSLPYTQKLKAHIAIEILVSRLSQRAQAVTDSVTSVLSIGIIALIIWRCVVYGTHLWEVNQLSMTLRLPVFFLLYVIAFGFTLLWLQLWLHLASVLKGLVRR